MEGYTYLKNLTNNCISQDAVECPHCGINGVPEHIFGLYSPTYKTTVQLIDDSPEDSITGRLIVLSKCTQKNCKHIFLVSFRRMAVQNARKLGEVTYYNDPILYVYSDFEEEPEELLPYQSISDKRPYYESFLKIYTQAYSAESNELNEIAGIGYRKALEFLIKDYAQHLKGDEKDKIIKMPLLQVIKAYLGDDKRLVDIASRAAWLGNDESHYLKKWLDRDVSDLKKVIILTLQSIEHTEATNEYINNMPEPK